MGGRRTESDTEGQNPAFTLLSRRSGDHFHYSGYLENALMPQPIKKISKLIGKYAMYSWYHHPVYVL